jgi:tyrosinase
MAVQRVNITTPANAAIRDKFVRGVKLLKQETVPGRTTSQFGIPGPAQPVSTYDLFVIWHHTAMMTLTPPTQSDRNSAHSGPVFLPWHRFMMILLEQHLQRVLTDPTFGLPYWDWGADGLLSATQQKSAQIWSSQCMGGQGSPVTTGPFAFNAASSNSWRVRLQINPFSATQQLQSTNRGLRRSFGQGIATLPTTTQITSLLNQTSLAYDAPSWDRQPLSFRNRLEGWRPTNTAPNLHNRVHVWVGGDMGPSTSPNDPVFYLNHCNVDRVWQGWLQRHPSVYVPPIPADPGPVGHRLTDAISAPLANPVTPQQMLDVHLIYTYDVVP